LTLLWRKGFPRLVRIAEESTHRAKPLAQSDATEKLRLNLAIWEAMIRARLKAKSERP
jgi:hypothetical protein